MEYKMTEDVLRDDFAKSALIGLLVATRGLFIAKDIANDAYIIANAMLTERLKHLAPTKIKSSPLNEEERELLKTLLAEE